MDASGLDEQLRRVYERNAPAVDEFDFARRLQVKSVGGRMRPAPRSRSRRTLLVALVSVAIVAGVAVGVYEAVAHIGRETPVVVITDDSMSPGGMGSGEQRTDPSSTDEVEVAVPVPQDILEIGFLDLWTRLTEAAGIDPNEASLWDLKVSFEHPSGSLVSFDLQALSRDGYELHVGYSASAGSLSMLGSRLPEFTPFSPSSASVDELLSALDMVGMQSLLGQLDISKSLDDDVIGVEMHLADRSDQGLAEIGGQVRAYYYEPDGWVRLDPDDARRIAKRADIVLSLHKVRQDADAVSADDYASFVIPAEATGAKAVEDGGSASPAAGSTRSPLAP